MNTDVSEKHDNVRTGGEPILVDDMGKSQKPWRFWAVFPALPTIIDDLQSGGIYIWIINAYTLSMTAL
ncbi:hypothetical protein K458DRAFT_386735 [Lentithecium fluviatile CBS 122367]|uniref:Uncharacterized protein n=1 Tax=Lentithecium fluviatile CBS 122367 TaxID=1168545 RepID=A0A6G1J8C0_9PLEO|nr:hypothetical protein K458DRAFT_386735 [Lentithecium fluviatile CBS 122367]